MKYFLPSSVGVLLSIFDLRLHTLLSDYCWAPLHCSRQSPLRHILAMIWLCTLVGCTTYTHERLLNEGKVDGFTMNTGDFEHQLFWPEPAILESSSNSLHIYLGGDGLPWRTPKQVATDPTSKRSTMLKLMLLSDVDAVYVGRPCYYQVTDARCQGRWWTHDRYHTVVVESLLKVVEQLGENYEELWLIGYSGGGTLAVLLGNRLTRPVNIVTVNANLDHQAWAEYHHYSPLTGSLNPIDDPAHNPVMQELHWYAKEDQNVLPAWTLAYCQKLGAQCLPVAGSHSGGWPEIWPVMLDYSKEFFAEPKGSGHP